MTIAQSYNVPTAVTTNVVFVVSLPIVIVNIKVILLSGLRR